MKTPRSRAWNLRDKVARTFLIHSQTLSVPVQDLKAWIVKFHNKRLWWILGMVKAKLRGLYNYFDVIGNSTKLQEMYILYKETFYRLLNRRSQRKSFNMRTFTYILNQHGIVRHRSQLLNTGT